MVLTKLPKRPYANFEDYVLRGLRGTKDNVYRCTYCRGSGRVIAPYEVPSPVEGYKMADRIKCQTCAGTGGVSRDLAMLWYRQKIREWKEWYAKAREERDLELAALKKARKHLTKAELNILGIE